MEGTPSLRELLAEQAHLSWSDWMRYVFLVTTGEARPDGAVVIPASFVKRWTRQMNTSYSELPEDEKESDRFEADKVLEIFNNYHKGLLENSEE